MLSLSLRARLKLISLYVLSFGFVMAGFNHFKNPEFYLKMMPTYLPSHGALNLVAGAFEMLLGMMLIRPEVRSLAAWGLILFLVAVLPAHVHMLSVGGSVYGVPDFLLWLRIPLQFVLMAWIFIHTKNPEVDRRKVETETFISVSPKRVWDELTAFENYSAWNPFLIEVKGAGRVGNTMTIRIRREAEVETAYKSIVTERSEVAVLSWRVSLLFRGLLDVTHYFEVHSHESEGTRFVHGERLEGLLVGLLASVFGAARPSFESMNRALKARCEGS